MQTNHFDAAAQTYNNNATIQEFSASQLMKRVTNHRPTSILDIGCGTGLLTQKLRHLYPQVPLTAVDASNAMLRQLAKRNLPNVTSIQLDYTHQLMAQPFDLIVSNAAIQWMNVPQCLQRIANQLSDNGHADVAIYGRHTCHELEAVLQTINKQQPLPAKQFLTTAELTKIGTDCFSHWSITTITKTIPYQSVIQLLTTQKQTGVHANRPKGLWTPRTIQALETAFYARYHRIQLTYEIHLCRGKK